MFRMGKLVTPRSVSDGVPLQLMSKAFAALAARQRISGGPSLDDMKADDLQLVVFGAEVKTAEVRSPQPKQRIGAIAVAELNSDLFESSRAMLVKSGELLHVRDRLGCGIVAMVEDADAWLVSPIKAEGAARSPPETLGASLSDEAIVALRALVDGEAFELETGGDPEDDAGYSLFSQRSEWSIPFDRVRDDIEAGGFNQWLHRYQHNINQPWKLVIARCHREVARSRMQELGLDERMVRPSPGEPSPSL